MRIPKLTYANVAATLALFLALGGGAYALTLGKNSVKRKNIAPGAVSTKKLAKNAVTGAKAKESSFGTVPDAAKLGGTPPGGFVSGENAVQRVHNEAVQLNADGVLFTVTGVGTIQFGPCKTPSAGTHLGELHYDNTSSQDEEIWATIYADGSAPVPDTQHITQLAGGMLSPVFQLPNNEASGRVELQVSSRGTPSEVLVATLSATYDAVANPDVCRYSLWTNKTEESPG